MSPEYCTIAALAFVGLLVGLILFVSQPSAGASMNPIGLLAFCSLGASVGCLLADRGDCGRWW